MMMVIMRVVKMMRVMHVVGDCGESDDGDALVQDYGSRLLATG